MNRTEGMSAHTTACEESRALCESLYSCLSKKIPNLQRSQSKNWCGLFQPGHKRFAYINHTKRKHQISIWFSGDPSDFQKKTSLTVMPRKKIETGWEKAFPARIFLRSQADVESACDALFQVSYRSVL